MEEDKTPSVGQAEVKIVIGGPILIKGIFRFRESSGKITEGEQEIYLCGCGGSSSKPWCDCTHKKKLEGS